MGKYNSCSKPPTRNMFHPALTDARCRTKAHCIGFQPSHWKLRQQLLRAFGLWRPMAGSTLSRLNPVLLSKQPPKNHHIPLPKPSQVRFRFVKHQDLKPAATSHLRSTVLKKAGAAHPIFASFWINFWRPIGHLSYRKTPISALV